MQGRDEAARGVNERIITIVGGENHVLQAVGRILKKCLEDPAFEEYRTQSLANNGTSSMVSGMQVRPRSAHSLCATPETHCYHLAIHQDLFTAQHWQQHSVRPLRCA